MITGINESKILTKLLSCKCKCKFGSIKCTQIKSGLTISADMSAKIQRNMYAKNIIFGILLHVVAKMANI